MTRLITQPILTICKLYKTWSSVSNFKDRKIWKNHYKFFWTWNFWGANFPPLYFKLWTTILFANLFFLTNIVWTHIFFRKNVIGPNNSYGPKSLTKIFAMKKLMVPKKFCTKECLVKKNVRSNKNFKSKQTLCPKNLSQNNS